MSVFKTRVGVKVADPQGLAAPRPVLHLSGPKLRAAYETLVAASERLGGIERFAEATRLKAVVFQDRLAEGKAADLTRAGFEEIVPLMATVRRRIGPYLQGREWILVRAAIVELLEGAHDTTIADERVARFESVLRVPGGRLPAGESPGTGKTRFLRDLAAEILHNTLPEYYPLMQRWVWDTKSNTGALREIWHDPQSGDDVDHIVIDVADNYETFLMLREELSQFLADNGVYRDMLWHVDLVLAQVYGDYVSSQGGAWLKTDFSSDVDPLEHSRRIVGLDRVAAKRSGRDKTVDGSAAAHPATKLLT